MCGQLRTNFSNSGTNAGSSETDGELDDGDDDGGDDDAEGSSCEVEGEFASGNYF